MSENREILIDDPESWFDGILLALNSENAIRRAEMRKLFEAWRSSGPDVHKLLRSNPEIPEFLFGKGGVPKWRAHPVPSGTGIRIMVEPMEPDPPKDRTEFILQEARGMFMHFLMNPLRSEILGPCARSKCDRFFRRRRKADTKYCTRECAQLQAGANSADKRRQDEHEDKLRRAKKSIQRWRHIKTRLDWKASVHEQEPDITSKFLTRAVNKGLLEPPPEGKRQIPRPDSDVKKAG